MDLLQSPPIDTLDVFSNYISGPTKQMYFMHWILPKKTLKPNQAYSWTIDSAIDTASVNDNFVMLITIFYTGDCPHNCTNGDKLVLKQTCRAKKVTDSRYGNVYRLPIKSIIITKFGQYDDCSFKARLSIIRGVFLKIGEHEYCNKKQCDVGLHHRILLWKGQPPPSKCKDTRFLSILDRGSGKCYFMSLYKSYDISWHEAKLHCMKAQGELAKFDSQTELLDIKYKLVSQINRKKDIPAFFGLCKKVCSIKNQSILYIKV